MNWDKIWGDKRPKIKLIIAGGRHYKFTDEDIRNLDKIFEEYNITFTVSGGASGADLEGEEWAARKGLSTHRFFPDWQTHGKAAGPIRNEEMAKYADAVALFPGGKGTESMHRLAKKHDLLIFDFRNES